MSAYFSYNDNQLVDLLKNGDASAFGQLYERYWKSLYNNAYKRLRDHESCEDIIQEIFTDLWLRKHLVDITDVAAYLHTAVRFQVLKIIDKNRKNEHFINLWRTLPHYLPSADLPLREKELAQLMEDWLNTLPEARRRIFIKHYIDQVSSKNISEELNISPKTVRNQIATAIHAMRIKFAHFFGSFFI